MPLWLACLQPWVIDGDSVRCRNLGEIRVLGIDSADRTSSRPCREHFGNHFCDDARAKKAKNSLIALRMRMKGERWTVRPFGRDRYGRLLAQVRVGPVHGWQDGHGSEYVDVACHQLGNGSARYIPEYDNGGVVAAACGR